MAMETEMEVWRLGKQLSSPDRGRYSFSKLGKNIKNEHAYMRMHRPDFVYREEHIKKGKAAK